MHLQSHLAGTCAKQHTLSAYDITKIIEVDCRCESLFPKIIEPQVELNAAGSVVYVGKRRLTHLADGEDAAGEANGLSGGGKRFKAVESFLGGMGARKA